MKLASLPGRIAGAIRRHPFWTIAVVPLAIAAYVVALIPFTPSIGDIKKAKQEQPSVVLAADGKELAVFRRANRDWVKLSDISPKVTAALLATEDNDFLIRMGVSRDLLTEVMYRQQAVGTDENPSTRYCLTNDEAHEYNVANIR